MIWPVLFVASRLRVGMLSRVFLCILASWRDIKAVSAQASVLSGLLLFSFCSVIGGLGEACPTRPIPLRASACLLFMVAAPPTAARCGDRAYNSEQTTDLCPPPSGIARAPKKEAGKLPMVQLLPKCDAILFIYGG